MKYLSKNDDPFSRDFNRYDSRAAFREKKEPAENAFPMRKSL